MTNSPDTTNSCPGCAARLPALQGVHIDGSLCRIAQPPPPNNRKPLSPPTMIYLLDRRPGEEFVIGLLFRDQANKVQQVYLQEYGYLLEEITREEYDQLLRQMESEDI